MSKISKQNFLLQEDDSRYVMFPLQDQDIWKNVQKTSRLFLEGRRNRFK